MSAAVIAALTVLAGCEAPADDQAQLPPQEVGDLAPLFADELAELGVELTERGGLIDRSDGYTASDEGTHLALYVVPLEERSADRYVDGILEITRVFADVFERWPELDSFDVCQERHPGDPRREWQLTVTQIELTRATTAAIEWDAVSLSGLLRSLEADPDSFLRVSRDLATHPELRRAQAEAREPAERDGDGSG